MAGRRRSHTYGLEYVRVAGVRIRRPMAVLLITGLLLTCPAPAELVYAADLMNSGSGLNTADIAYDTNTGMGTAALPGTLSYAGSVGLDEALALELYDTAHADSASGSAAASSRKNDSAGGALMKAKPAGFGMALAQRCEQGEGRLVLDEGSRFIIAQAEPSKRLLSTVRLMAGQFRDAGIASDKKLSVVRCSADEAEAGDIVIRIVPQGTFYLPVKTADIRQSYKLVTGDRATITACSADGVYYGLLELMEIACQNRKIGSGGNRSSSARSAATGSKASADKSGISLNNHTVRIRGIRIYDGPDYAERIIHLDCGRKYFSKKWIRKLIRRSSMQRYNVISLHFSEAEGLRLDSKKFPWLTKGIRSLSREDMADIVRTAERYHMKVMPSFDVPSHNKYIVKKYASHVRAHPDFSFKWKGKRYDRRTKGFGSIANHFQYNGAIMKADYIGIDITKKHAVAFMNALISDYAEFFRGLGCTEWDMCGDEILGWYTFDLGGRHFTYANRWGALEHWKKYAAKQLGIRNASASDTFINYLNKTARMLQKKGYRVRVFNDDIDILPAQHLKLDKSIGVTWWYTSDNSAGHFRKAGHRVYGCDDDWCFYVVRTRNGKDIMKGRYKSVNSRNIYNNWNPGKFNGCCFCIWCDRSDYKSAGTIWKETAPRTWAYACRMWNKQVNTDKSGIRDAAAYEDMMKWIERLP